MINLLLLDNFYPAIRVRVRKESDELLYTISSAISCQRRAVNSSLITCFIWLCVNFENPRLNYSKEISLTILFVELPLGFLNFDFPVQDSGRKVP